MAHTDPNGYLLVLIGAAALFAAAMLGLLAFGQEIGRKMKERR